MTVNGQDQQAATDRDRRYALRFGRFIPGKRVMIVCSMGDRMELNVSANRTAKGRLPTVPGSEARLSCS
jgi:hypothetical protein